MPPLFCLPSVSPFTQITYLYPPPRHRLCISKASSRKPQYKVTTRVTLALLPASSVTVRVTATFAGMMLLSKT